MPAEPVTPPVFPKPPKDEKELVEWARKIQAALSSGIAKTFWQKRPRKVA